MISHPKRTKSLKKSQDVTLTILQFCDQRIDYTQPELFRSDPDVAISAFYTIALTGYTQSSLKESSIKAWFKSIALNLEKPSDLKQQDSKYFSLKNKSVSDIIELMVEKSNTSIADVLKPISATMTHLDGLEVKDDKPLELEASKQNSDFVNKLKIDFGQLATKPDFIQQFVNSYNVMKLNTLLTKPLKHFEHSFDKANPYNVVTDELDPYKQFIKEHPELKDATLGELPTDSAFWAGLAKKTMATLQLLDETSLELNVAWKILLTDLQEILKNIFAIPDVQNQLSHTTMGTDSEGKPFQQASKRDILDRIIRTQCQRMAKPIQYSFRNFYSFLRTNDFHLTGQILAQYLSMVKNALNSSEEVMDGIQFAVVTCQPVAKALKLGGNLVDSSCQDHYANTQSLILDITFNNWLIHYLMSSKEFTNPDYFDSKYLGTVHEIHSTYEKKVTKALDETLAKLWKLDGQKIKMLEPILIELSPPLSPRQQRKLSKKTGKKSLENNCETAETLNKKLGEFTLGETIAGEEKSPSPLLARKGSKWNLRQRATSRPDSPEKMSDESSSPPFDRKNLLRRGRTFPSPRKPAN